MDESGTDEHGWAEILIVLVLFLAIGGVLVWAFVIRKPDDSKRGADTSTTSTVPTPSTLPTPRLYKVTDGVNIRAGPATTFAVVGRVEVGNQVLVECRTEGQLIDGPAGPTNQWLRTTVDGKVGFVTAQYVDIHADLTNAAVVGVCPPAAP